MQIRNLAIIAHVDHGKTTLIDGLLKQSHLFRDNQSEMSQDRILDSKDQEAERGITILAKNTAITYQDTKINIIDTPGHADFGGEVERVINMADGALLIVDAAEGPLPQTRFVLEQALKQNLKIIVVINKIDRKDAEPLQVLAKTEELFLEIADDESQLDFPVIYSIGRDAKAWDHLPADIKQTANLDILFKYILQYIPEPQADPNQPFKMLVSNLDFDNYQGRYAVGKISQGQIKTGQTVSLVLEDKLISNQKIKKIFEFRGLSKVEAKEGKAGDIIALTGLENVAIGQTLTDPDHPQGFPAIKISQPTLSIQIAANSSPFKGQAGQFFTQRQIQDRLVKEQQTNLGLKIKTNPNGQGFIISGRGELHLAVLIEDMRREGYELEVSKPEVIFKKINGSIHEPVEELTITIHQDYLGLISEEMAKRRAQLLDTHTNLKNISQLIYQISSQNLLGFRSQILSKTRGNGLFASRFLAYFEKQNNLENLRGGALVATENGMTTSYAIHAIQQRGETFVEPGVKVYQGQIVGLNFRKEDLDVNICKGKQLTNMRAASADATIKIAPAKKLSLEQCLDFINSDELLEVTPLSLRLRKKILDKNLRYKAKN